MPGHLINPIHQQGLTPRYSTNDLLVFGDGIPYYPSKESRTTVTKYEVVGNVVDQSLRHRIFLHASLPPTALSLVLTCYYPTYHSDPR